MPARNEAELVAASHENFVGSFRKLAEHCPGGEVRETGAVFAFVTGLPLSLFNGCLVTGPAQAYDVAQALEWLASRDVPHRAWVAADFAPALRDVFAGHDLALEPEPYPGMVLNPPPAAPAPAAGVEVARVEAAGLDEFWQVAIDGGAPPDLARRLIPPSFAADPAVQLFVGRLDGRAVGHVDRDPDQDRGRDRRRLDPPRGSASRSRRRHELGRRFRGRRAQARHDRVAGVADGLPGVCGDGLPDGRSLRSFQLAVRMCVDVKIRRDVRGQYELSWPCGHTWSSAWTLRAYATAASCGAQR